MTHDMTHDQIQDLPPVLNVTTAAQILDIGRSLAYELIRTGTWPTPVLHVGRLIKIPTAPLLRLLDEGADGHEHGPLRSSTARTYETITRP